MPRVEDDGHKAFRVTGWKQYRTDAAVEIDRVQIARTADDAIADVADRFGDDTRFYLKAVPVLPC